MKSPEKIYICNLGSELSYDWSNEHCYESDIEYTRTEVFVEKACDAYCKVCGHYAHTTPTHICRKVCEYYKDFRKYIEGE